MSPRRRLELLEAAREHDLLISVRGGGHAVAGALYVPQVGIINPSEMSPANSIEIAIWVAVGGRATLIGPVIFFRAATPVREALGRLGIVDFKQADPAAFVAHLLTKTA